MKKILSLVLAVMMIVSMAACSNTPANTTTAPKVEVPANALEILTKLWGTVTEKFPVMGGDYETMVDGNPGTVNVKTPDFLTSTLLVPETELAKITDAASLVHGMMLNNLTCGVFRVGSANAAAFADAMHTAVAGNRWMCGMPEKMVIAIVGGEYVLMMFGINDALKGLETGLASVYPDAVVKYNEAITG